MTGVCEVPLAGIYTARALARKSEVTRPEVGGRRSIVTLTLPACVRPGFNPSSRLPHPDAKRLRHPLRTRMLSVGPVHVTEGL